MLDCEYHFNTFKCYKIAKVSFSQKLSIGLAPMNPRFSQIHILPRMGLVVSMFIIFQSVALALGTLFSYQVLGADTVKVQEGVLSNSQDWMGFMTLQGISSLIGFGLTAIIFSFLEAGNFKRHLGLSGWPTFKLLVLGILAIVAAQFFVELLVTVNKLLRAPEAMLEMQARIEKMIDSATNFTSPFQFFIAVIVMAVIPAIAEEFFFRGLIMGDLLKAGLSPARSIIISGIIFSIVHFEFHNFLAIGVLGIFLGYLYYVSGSLWLCIVAHFVNNFFAVLMRYLLSLGLISQDLADAKTPMWLSLIGLSFFSVILFALYQQRTNSWEIQLQSLAENEQQED